MSKRNSVHPSENAEPANQSPKRPPSLQPPNFPPPPPPTQTLSTSDKKLNPLKTSPQRPPSIVRSSLSPTPAANNTESVSVTKSVFEEVSQPTENAVEEIKVPSRPPPLDTNTVTVLRERSRSQGKRTKDKSPSRPPSTYMEAPSAG